jgi:hypothetical protein
MAADLILENDKVRVVDGDLEVDESVTATGRLSCRDENSENLFFSVHGKDQGGINVVVGDASTRKGDRYTSAQIRVRAKNGDSTLSSRQLRTHKVSTNEIGTMSITTSSLTVGAAQVDEGNTGLPSGSVKVLDNHAEETVTIDGEKGDIFLRALGDTVADRIRALERRAGTGGGGGSAPAPPEGRIEGSLQFANNDRPLAFIFESGSRNPDRPLLAHSPAYPNWGLMYRDQGDQMIFQSGGNPVATVDLHRKRVGIGTDSPQHDLHVNGVVAGTEPFRNLSDVRCKKDVETIERALEMVRQLRGVSFQWREEGCEGLRFGDGRQVGFIAQEVEAVLPEIVHEDDEGYKSVAYSAVVSVLTEAVKEQQAVIDVQSEKIEVQGEQVRMLRDDLAECLDAVRALRREVGTTSPGVSTDA